jgi:hypothetical protein
LNVRLGASREREALARAIVDGNSYMTPARPTPTGCVGVAGLVRAGFVLRVLLGHEAQREALPEHRRAADIAIVIFDSTVPIGTGKAVYMAARAEEVTAAGEIERGMAVFSERSVAQGGLE